MTAFLYDNYFWQYELIFIGRLMLAMVLGGIIGLERELKNHSAGFRTHILVTVGSCIFMLVSVSMPVIITAMPNGTVNNVDPSRIAAQVVSGIGFLGAGAIIQAKGRRIHGLTTAASLWVVAAIGLAVGAGLYLTSIIATIMLLIILTSFSRLESKLAAMMQRQQQDEKTKEYRSELASFSMEQQRENVHSHIKE
ncbi:MAG: MgtC/SapB family protein [Peptococcaceae bacterium]